MTLLWGAADKLITLKSFHHWKNIVPHASPPTKSLTESSGYSWSTVLVAGRAFLADEAPELVA